MLNALPPSTMPPLPGADEAPGRVHALPAGAVRGVEGRGPRRQPEGEG